MASSFCPSIARYAGRREARLLLAAGAALLLSGCNAIWTLPDNTQAYQPPPLDQAPVLASAGPAVTASPVGQVSATPLDAPSAAPGVGMQPIYDAPAYPGPEQQGVTPSQPGGGPMPLGGPASTQSAAPPSSASASAAQGQVTAQSPSPAPAVYTVQSGDSLSVVAGRLGVTTAELAAANDIQPPYNIRVGQTLAVPGATQVAASTPQPASAASSQPPTAPQPVTPPSSQAQTPQPAASASESPTQTTSAPQQTTSAATLPEGRFQWPLTGEVVSGFGTVADGQTNDGINIAAPAGTPVRAAQAGTVAYAGNELRGYGNLLLIRHPGGWVTAYAHNDSLRVQRGDSVAAGQVIATVGSTGSVSSPQLHFEIRQGSTPVDPMDRLGG